MKKFLCVLLTITSLSAFASSPIASFDCNGTNTDGDELSIQTTHLTNDKWNKSVTLLNHELLFMFEKNGKVSISTDLSETSIFAVGEKEASLELHSSHGGAGSEGEKKVRELFCTIRKI